MNLQPRVQGSDENLGGVASTSLLFRLVDVAARTLEAASPLEGHLARRYVPLLRGMTGIIQSGNTQTQRMNGEASIVMTDTSIQPEQVQSNLEENLWEMWQQAGLEPTIWSSLPNGFY